MGRTITVPALARHDSTKAHSPPTKVGPIIDMPALVRVSSIVEHSWPGPWLFPVLFSNPFVSLAVLPRRVMRSFHWRFCLDGLCLGLASYGLPERIGTQARAVAALGRLRPTVTRYVIHIARVSFVWRGVCAWHKLHIAHAWCVCVARNMCTAHTVHMHCMCAGKCAARGRFMTNTPHM